MENLANKEEQTLLIAIESMLNNNMRILRDQQVMFGTDVSKLYEVTSEYLQNQVRKNIRRFPKDFMFRLTTKELESLKTEQLPYAFTEKGILMAGSILNSERAVKVHIQLIRYFVQLYKESLSKNSLLEEINTAIENKEVEPLFEIFKHMLKD